MSSTIQIAWAHIAEERSVLPLHALNSVKVHSGRLGLPITPTRLAGLRVNPLVETPLRLIFVPRFDQFG